MIKVYVLHSSSLKKFYVGQTSNLEIRLLQHNNGESKYTSRGIPWEIVQVFNCEHREEAIKLELRIKKRGIKRYLEDNSISIGV